MSWKKVRLGDVIEFNPKVSLEKDSEYECIEMEHIKPGFKYAYPAKFKSGKGSGSKFKNGDTLFARITPCLENGKIAEAKGLKKNIGIGSTEFFVLRNRQGYTEKEFVYYLAQTDLIRGTAEKSMQGASGRQRAIKETVENVQITLPPLSVQKRIADILSAYDNLIENNLQRIKHLEAMATCEYKMLMKESGVEIRKLIDENILTMGQSPPSNTYNNIKEGLPFHQGVTNFGTRFVQHEIHCSIPTRKAVAGDILMSVRAPVGRLNFASDTICIGRGLCAIRNKKGFQQIQFQILKEFFFFEDRIGTGSTFNATTKNELENLELEFPVSSRLEEVEMKLQNMHQQMLNLTLQNTHLRQIRDTLLPKLMSGEIEINNKVSSAKVVEMSAPKKALKTKTEKKKTGAKYYFRTVLASYIVNKLWQENTFGHVKLMKLMYLCEHLADIETVSNYHRDAAGPYDNQMIRSIDKQMKVKGWFEMYKNEAGFPKYRELSKHQEHEAEFIKYYGEKQTGVDSLIQRFGTEKTEKVEMVATIYEAWRSLKDRPEGVTVENVLDEVLNKWHDSKKRISSERWVKCYEWMKEQGWVF